MLPNRATHHIYEMFSIISMIRLTCVEFEALESEKKLNHVLELAVKNYLKTC